MKVVLISLFILLYSIVSLGQKTKTELVWKKPISGETIYSHYNYNESDSLVSIDIQFVGINSKYIYLDDVITLFSGSPQQFFDFLNKIEKFVKENPAKTSTHILGQLIMTDEVMKIKGAYINDKKGLGYRSFTLKALTKFRTKFVDWCKKNKIPYE